LSENETLERPDDPKDTARLKAVLVVVATIAFVVTPFIADPFTGFDPALLPNPVDDPPIQPAGWAFAIWGVIYLWLLVSAGYGLFKRDTDPDWDRLRWPLFASIAIGASWISVALIAPVFATVLIWVMLATALLALRLAPYRDYPWLALPLGLYAGWLTAASCVALATVAAGYGLGSTTTLSWVGVAIALIMAITITQSLRVPTYPLAVAWALAGIVAANATAAPAFAGAALGGVLGMLWLMVKVLRPRA
jgi:hypothetical protein